MVRAGKTFRYADTGRTEGLFSGKNKKVLAIVTSAGSYVESPGLAALDHEIPYLRFIFGFMGIGDVRFVQAGGTTGVARGQISADAYLAPYLEQIAAAI